jgi:Protein of unknown function (DUF3485)
MRLLPIFLTLPLVVAFGIGEGLWTNRWGWSDGTERAAARLAGVPRTLGDWQGQDEQLDARQIARAEMVGYVLRRYVNRRTGAQLSVLLVCGRPGPTSVHTPEVCFPGAGYALAAPAERQDIALEGQPLTAQLWRGQFQKGGAVPDAVRIYWGWTANGDWSAPDHPRVTFASARALYKLYVTRSLSRPDEPLAEDPSGDFLRAFLPELRQCLFPDNEGIQKTSSRFSVPEGRLRIAQHFSAGRATSVGML